MKKQFSQQEIFVNEIQFFKKNEICLLGFVFSEGKFQRTQFVCSRKVLHALLAQNGRQGREIAMLLRKLFATPHAVPLTVDLIDRFGTTQPLRAYSIQMQIPFGEYEPQKKGSLSTSELLLIERVLSFPA